MNVEKILSFPNFISSSLLFPSAYKFTNDYGYKYIQRIIIFTGMPILFLEGLTLKPNEFEVLLPINTGFIIKNPYNKVIPVFYDPLKDINTNIKKNINATVCNKSFQNVRLTDIHAISYTPNLDKVKIIAEKYSPIYKSTIVKKRIRISPIPRTSPTSRSPPTKKEKTTV